MSIRFELRKLKRWQRRRKLADDPAYCAFQKFFHPSEWSFYGHGQEGKKRGLEWGVTPNDRNRPIQRCPSCNKRLKMRAVFCIGGEFISWEIPEHKPRVTRSPSPKRKSKINGRGK